jgi:LemA protein
MGTTLIIILIALVVIGLVALSVYNSLVRMKNQVQEAASDIDVQLKRRHDLIPNLIETVKGAANFEKSTLEAVINARKQAVDITGLGQDKAAAENMLSGTLRQLFALSESYPELKANQSFLELQTELTNTEDRILASRRFYNQTVRDYNTYQEQFPGMLFKGFVGATKQPYFELEDPSEKAVPKVSF